MADAPSPSARSWPSRLGPLAVGLATLALMVATEPRLAIVWDEGFVLGREARVRSWARAMLDPPGFAARWSPPTRGTELVQDDGMAAPRPDEVDTRGKLLSPRAIAWFWPFAREEPHGHPPFYAIAGMLGDLVAPASWADLPRARLGPEVAFAIAAGAIFGAVARRWGTWAGALAAGAWALQPNLFGHGHYATLDGLLASLWVGAVLAFGAAVEGEGKGKGKGKKRQAGMPAPPCSPGGASRPTPPTSPGGAGIPACPTPSPETSSRTPRWGAVLLFGLLCGWAADTKLTGWFLPLPFVLWALLYRDRRGWLTIGVGGVVAVAVLYAFNPCWWSDPVGGVERFLRSNLTRGKTIPIPVAFLGRVYKTPNESLPWWNTLAWTVMVTPVGFLGFALAGLGRAIRGRDRFGVLVGLQWGMLLALRGSPHTPGHDGVRLFLPAFGMLAILAGAGASGVRGRWGKGLAVAALVEGIISVGVMMPVPLAYFSPVVGGLPGAAALGMEPTYFWDALSAEDREWLRARTPPGRSVRFATFPTSWLYLKRTGQLRAPVWPIDPGRPAWYVLQNRPGAFSPEDERRVRDETPAHQSGKLGVPLILIYPLGAGPTHAERP